MILHPDGRVEGTPEEVAAYKRAVSENATTQLVTEGRIRQPDIPFPQANVDIRAKQQQAWSGINASTKEMVDELSRRTGVKHVPVLQQENLRLQISNEKTLFVKWFDDLADWDYILIERD